MKEDPPITLGLSGLGCELRESGVMGRLLGSSSTGPEDISATHQNKLEKSGVVKDP